LQKIGNKDISFLVNNVGVGVTTYFDKMTEKDLKRVIAVNCGA